MIPVEGSQVPTHQILSGVTNDGPVLISLLNSFCYKNLCSGVYACRT